MSAELFHGLSHVDVPVSNLERALAIYQHTLGFAVKRRGGGWVELDGGASALRLFVTHRAERPASLRLSTPDVLAAYRALLGAGARALYEPMRTPELELVAAVEDSDRNTLVVWRELSEDEYETPPELPTALRWQPEAEALLKSLLQSVPALFRGLARRRVVHAAEHLAGARRVVGREEVVRGFILASARPTRHRVRRPLLDHGVDLGAYAEDFDA